MYESLLSQYNKVTRLTSLIKKGDLLCLGPRHVSGGIVLLGKIPTEHGITQQEMQQLHVPVSNPFPSYESTRIQSGRAHLHDII